MLLVYRFSYQGRLGRVTFSFSSVSSYFLQELQKQSKTSGELSVLQFRKECMEGLVKIVKKLQDKSPLKYQTVTQMSCLDPAKLYTSPELCQSQMKSLVKQFIQYKQLDGGVAGGTYLTNISFHYFKLLFPNESLLLCA